MPLFQSDEYVRSPAISPPPPRTRYLIARQQDAWVILFGGEEYGPYRSEREAKLFATEAAHRLGKQGKHTEVIIGDEAGNLVPAWIHGQHPYPPRE